MQSPWLPQENTYKRCTKYNKKSIKACHYKTITKHKREYQKKRGKK